jgi:hypothetical protein
MFIFYFLFFIKNYYNLFIFYKFIKIFISWRRDLNPQPFTPKINVLPIELLHFFLYPKGIEPLFFI